MSVPGATETPMESQYDNAAIKKGNFLIEKQLLSGFQHVRDRLFQVQIEGFDVGETLTNDILVQLSKRGPLTTASHRLSFICIIASTLGATYMTPDKRAKATATKFFRRCGQSFSIVYLGVVDKLYADVAFELGEKAIQKELYSDYKLARDTCDLFEKHLGSPSVTDRGLTDIALTRLSRRGRLTPTTHQDTFLAILSELEVSKNNADAIYSLVDFMFCNCYIYVVGGFES